MRKFRLSKVVCVVILFCAATAIVSPAQTFTTLANFGAPSGANSDSSLIQGTDGNLYGTTAYGGASGAGSVFKMTPAGTLTTLHSFNNTDGANPNAGLVQATDGNFYGTTTLGGATGFGTVFKMTPAGTLTTLHSFCSQPNCADGWAPESWLVLATDGNFYGATSGASSNCNGGNCGTIFKITPGGTLTTLYSFGGADGEYPYAGLVLATDGNFYGTTYIGGVSKSNCASYGCGTIFRITPTGTLTTLHKFDYTDGGNPDAGLVQATDGNFYGTTNNGGANAGGTVFKITPSGTLTSLYSFCSQPNCTDGNLPQVGLVQATDGNFYGTTTFGGANGYGTVFKITPQGALTTLHSFDYTDGWQPVGGLIQVTDGYFYGTTFVGGANGNCTNGCGTAFSLDVGLSPFVETQPTSG